MLFHNSFSPLEGVAKQVFLAPSPGGEGWGEGDKRINFHPYFYSYYLKLYFNQAIKQV